MTKPNETTGNTFAMLARDNADDCRQIMREIIECYAKIHRLRADLATKIKAQPALERLAQEAED